MRISEIYNMDVYADNGQYLGEVLDAIVDLERGEVSRLLMEEMRNIDRIEMRKMLQNKSVLFKNVRNIGDVVLVAAQNPGQQQADANAAPDMSELVGRGRR
ncbi:MAG: PRC-barrel domain-containing protein [Candidatus Micrarchaeaceae archaeon]